jgi:Pyrimidine dimer DNA glycosylase
VRMWMIDPTTMCRRHLLGEHVELHMLTGHLRRGRMVGGYVARNCIEPLAISRRHKAIAAEMVRRGYSHNSRLLQPATGHLPEWQRRARVDTLAAWRDLAGRCQACKALGTQAQAGRRPEMVNAVV